MPSRRFPKPWTVEPIPSGYRVIDANGVVLAHVYGQPDGAIAASDTRLTNDEARRISKLIARLPELVGAGEGPEQGQEPSQAQPIRFKPVTIGDLIREGKLLEVHCGNCRPERHLYLNPRSCGCQSACRYQRWLAIWSAASAVPGTARPIIRSGQGRIPGSQVWDTYPDFIGKNE